MIAISFGVWMCTCNAIPTSYIIQIQISWIPNLFVKMQYRATTEHELQLYDQEMEDGNPISKYILLGLG